MANPPIEGRAAPESVPLSVRSAAQKLLAAGWLATALAIAGALVYVIQLWTYTHSQESVLDEGAYVYKGFLFASGQYTPYQPYGPWTNHMPLAFLIPGYFQTLFGPGLHTARYMAIGFGLLLLLGMWLVSRRIGGGWWAAVAVWALALNPALLKTYSTAVTQGMVACMLVWMLALTLGDDRRLWQLMLGAALAGAMLMTRINMLPVLPLLLLFILWQYGWKTGLLSGLAGGIVVIGLHAPYWPDILQVWTRIPKWMSPFLDAWRLPKDYKQSWKPDVLLIDRVLSLFHSLRFNFAAVTGVLATLFLWPKRSSWKKASDLRAAIFLAALFAALLLSHLWAALGKEYCTFCLAGYVAFFAEIGILLVILTAANWRQELPGWLQIVIAITILALSAGIGFGAFEQISEPLYNLSIPRWLMGDFQAGSVPLGAVIINKLAIEPQALRRVLPLVFGLAAGVLLVLITLAATRLRQRSPEPGARASFGYWALVVFLIAGTLLSPSRALGGGYGTYDCAGDMLVSYAAAGNHLRAAIPAGSTVYWKGTLSAVPLLYAPEIRIYPAQINDGYSMLSAGDDEQIITRFGRWNEALAHRWAAEADYILVEERQYRGWLREFLLAGGYHELPATPPAAACRPDSAIRIFEKLH